MSFGEERMSTRAAVIDTGPRPAGSQGQRSGVEIVRVDSQMGLGVRSRRAIRRGATVGPMVGEVSNQVSQHSLQISALLHMIDRAFAGYLLHSCDPNCVLDVHRLEVVAVREVAPGELLTIDYAVTEDVLHRQFACACGAANCRRWITGRREGPDAEGGAYLAGQA